MRYIITHGHIFKNAGSTFDYALKQAFGNDFCDHRDDKAMRQGKADYLKQFIIENPSLKAISSHHLCNPLPISEEFVCIPVFFVRNPIERIISVYNFEKKQKPSASLGAKMASKMTLIEYVKWRMSPESPMVIRNYQTAYIGDTNRMVEPKVSYTTFQNALARVNNQQTLVGSVERFDESFNQIAERLKFYFPDINFEYKSKNVSNKNSTTSKYQKAIDLLSPVLGEVLAKNAYDMVLSELINEKLSV